jgi:hypothetical protein
MPLIYGYIVPHAGDPIHEIAGDKTNRVDANDRNGSKAAFAAALEENPTDKLSACINSKYDETDY